ncbi:hypothetical protein JAAARDRAFT_70456 [Jaapia argillacea MUCL 33604]|uniref:Gfo/Idh/MocA-like oxidoreductase N-terminal domain-containing protein n=1 Tax=Jaapia argillacea MUCL 33604 TaxID=933084 RepID=A0A067PZR9_9AGAM|nr:hypothetical protein JAAARDRAFT_70456 [Jaapia argillacea MUCL 33604]
MSGIAILGAGIFAKEAHLPALASLPPSSYSLKAVYSRSQASAQSLADAASTTLSLSPSTIGVYYDSPSTPSHSLSALLARPDIAAVIVVLPITTQPAIILKSLEAGKHVISEKPVAPTVAAAIDLINIYESKYEPKGLIWRVAENFECEPGYRKAGELVREGRIGKVIGFGANIVNYIDKDSKWYKTPWRTVPDYQGGFLLDGGVHFAAALRVALGPTYPLSKLSAFSALHKSWLAPHDTINAVIRCGTPSTSEATSAPQGTYDLTFAAPSSSAGKSNGYTITGTTGFISITNVKSAIRITLTTVKVDPVTGKDLGEEVQVFDEEQCGVKMELKEFLGAVKGEKGWDVGRPREAVKDVAVIQASLESEGRLVDLERLVKVGSTF